MKISDAERQAIRRVLEHADDFGYGNLIEHLKTAWAAKLVRDGMDEKTARLSAGGGGYPFLMQRDLTERGEWDETGARYRTPKKRKQQGPQ